MDKAPDFDVAAAHRYFAAYCFNQAWTLIEKPDRTAEENLQMVALSQASIFHWSQREDFDDQRRSVGYWQASRIQAILGNAAEALRDAEVCLSCSAGLKPFYRGYAHEAMARACAVAGDAEAAARHLKTAHEFAASVIVKDAQAQLLADLARIEACV